MNRNQISTSLIIVMLISGCSGPDDVQNGASRVGLPDQESWEVTITLTKTGLKQAVIQAGHLEKYNDRQFTLLDDSVYIDFYDENEAHTSLLSALKAEIDEKSNYMTAMGNVVVVSDSGVTLYTDTLDWNSELELIYTDNPVMITTEQNDTLYGTGFESDAGLDHWKVIKPTGVTDRGQDE